MPKPAKSKKPKKQENVEQQVAKAFAHPLRVQILSILDERSASPNLLSKELGKNLNVVAYHVRVLESYKCIELVDTKQRRGATEHFYKSTQRQFLSTRMEVDEQGWKEVAALLAGTQAQLAEIQSEARRRLVADGGRALPSRVAIMHFKAPPADAGDSHAEG